MAGIAFLTSLGTPKYGRGTHAGSTSFQVLATVTLTVSKTYQGLEWAFSSFQESDMEIVLNDNGSETILHCVRVGAGSYSDDGGLENFRFVTGSGATQELIIRAKNLDTASTMHGLVATQEL